VWIPAASAWDSSAVERFLHRITQPKKLVDSHSSVVVEQVQQKHSVGREAFDRQEQEAFDRQPQQHHSVDQEF